VKGQWENQIEAPVVICHLSACASLVAWPSLFPSRAFCHNWQLRPETAWIEYIQYREYREMCTSFLRHMEEEEIQRLLYCVNREVVALQKLMLE
jgi:hypothetical protein